MPAPGHHRGRLESGGRHVSLKRINLKVSPVLHWIDHYQEKTSTVSWLQSAPVRMGRMISVPKPEPALDQQDERRGLFVLGGRSHTPRDDGTIFRKNLYLTVLRGRALVTPTEVYCLSQQPKRTILPEANAWLECDCAWMPHSEE